MPAAGTRSTRLQVRKSACVAVKSRIQLVQPLSRPLLTYAPTNIAYDLASVLTGCSLDSARAQHTPQKCRVHDMRKAAKSSQVPLNHVHRSARSLVAQPRQDLFNAAQCISHHEAEQFFDLRSGDVMDSIIQLFIWALIRVTCILVRLCGPVPEHMAFIMDGNRRFASNHGQEAQLGHRDGYRKVRQASLQCIIALAHLAHSAQPAYHE